MSANKFAATMTTEVTRRYAMTAYRSSWPSFWT
jgi:hypothetical protein